MTPLAAESLGVRGLALGIDTPDVRLLIDPSCALASRRFGLPPSPAEHAALVDARARLTEFGKSADVLVVSHYHWDHVSLDLDFYRRKLILAKSWMDATSPLCAARGQTFEGRWKPTSAIVYADGAEFHFGETIVRISPPLPHGPAGSRLGFVIATVVERGGVKVLHTSDTQGPMSDVATEWFLAESPDVLVVDGPPAYLAGGRVPQEDVDRACANLVRIARETRATILMDHHIFRGADAATTLPDLFRQAEPVSFAEYLGEPNRFLEANRRALSPPAGEPAAVGA